MVLKSAGSCKEYHLWTSEGNKTILEMGYISGIFIVVRFTYRPKHLGKDYTALAHVSNRLQNAFFPGKCL